MGPMEQGFNPSLCSLIYARERGRRGIPSFNVQVSRRLGQEKELLKDTEIVSPHRSAIASLALDRKMGRFLLAGSADGTVSVYDLSKWGKENTVQPGRDKHEEVCYPPVGRSIKVAAGVGELDVPSGHTCSITDVQWYPADTGAFLTCGSDSSLLLWDTNRMLPVLDIEPFDSDESSGMNWGSAQLQTGGDHSLVATGCWSDAAVKLVDVRSGAHSHQLTGHTFGISAVQWSPSMPLVLVSGSRDGTIRMWDIRKSGSQACITSFNRELSPSSLDQLGIDRPSYHADYSHLRRLTANMRKKNKKRKLQSMMRVAPNNYQLVQSRSGARAHSGHVAALSFLPDGNTLASVGGNDGELLLWDLREGPYVQMSKFVAPGGLAPSTPKQRRAALAVDDNETIWVGHQSSILGFTLNAASPIQMLKGHLNRVTSLDHMEPDGKLISGSRDGMILCWGRSKEVSYTRESALTIDRDNW